MSASPDSSGERTAVSSACVIAQRLGEANSEFTKSIEADMAAKPNYGWLAYPALE